VYAFQSQKAAHVAEVGADEGKPFIVYRIPGRISILIEAYQPAFVVEVLYDLRGAPATTVGRVLCICRQAVWPGHLYIHVKERVCGTYISVDCWQLPVVRR
jgi:hypothetical protein